MIGPKNLRDVGNNDLGDVLLSAARSEAHDEGAVERTLIALSLAASVTALGGVSVAKAAVSGAAGVGGAIGAGVGGTTAGTLGTGALGTGALGTGALGTGALAAVGNGLASAGAPGLAATATKSALLLTVGKWFGATAIAGGAALGGAQLWERSHDSTMERAALVVANVSSSPDELSLGSAAKIGSVATPNSVSKPGADSVSAKQTGPEESALLQGALGQSASRSAAPELAGTPQVAVASETAATAGANPGRSRAGVVPPAESPGPATANAGLPKVGLANVEPAIAAGGSRDFASEGSLPPGVSPLPADVHSEPAAPAPAVAATPERVARVARRGITLGLEVRSIDSVRERLNAGAPAEALSMLVKHRAQFGSGALGPEALFLQMEAERALGRHAAALRTARQILERFPKGPSAESARQLLAE